MADKSNPLLTEDNQGTQNQEPTALQKHVMFFDFNKDGIVYPSETFKGFRALGTNLFVSVIGAIFVNVGLSPHTRPGKGFSIHFPIEIANISKAKHGSATDAFNTDGRFDESKFETIFAKHAHTNKDYLTSDELSEMLKANREPKNFSGWVANFAEWKFLFHIAKDKDGHLKKETVKSLFEGTLFQQMAEERASKK